MSLPLTKNHFLVFVLLLGFVLLGFHPAADRITWFLENLPVLIIFPVLIATHKKFPLSMLLSILLVIHAYILMLGGYYTYAKVPLGFWMQDFFGFARNHYDRIGHLAQGFVPVILYREFLLRKSPLKNGWLLNTLCISMALAFSALYELFEWATAVVSGTAAEAFLGTQGDVWDTQWDMFMCLIGASLSLALLSRLHDASMKKVLK